MIIKSIFYIVGTKLKYSKSNEIVILIIANHKNTPLSTVLKNLLLAKFFGLINKENQLEVPDLSFI